MLAPSKAAPAVEATESSAVEMVKNAGCFWTTAVYKQQKGESPPKEKLAKYKEKGSKKWHEGVWMQGPLDTLVPGAINLYGKQRQDVSKKIKLTQDPASTLLILSYLILYTVYYPTNYLLQTTIISYKLTRLQSTTLPLLILSRPGPGAAGR